MLKIFGQDCSYESMLIPQLNPCLEKIKFGLVITDRDRKIIEFLNKGQELESKSECLKLKEVISVGTAFFPYRENYRIYKTRLQSYHSNHRNTSNNTIIRRRFQRKIIRDMMNTIISARVLIDIYSEEDYNNQFLCFMKELRNYFSHHSHVNLVSRIQIEDGKKDIYEKLPKKEIKEYLEMMIKDNPKWNGLKSAKNFLESHGEIRLNELIDTYHLEVMKLYRNELVSIVKLYSKELKPFIQESQELQKQAKEFGYTLEYPVIGAKLRYVSCLLNKVL